MARARAKHELWEALHEKRRANRERRERRDRAFKRSIEVAAEKGWPNPELRARFLAVYVRDKIRRKLGTQKKVGKKDSR